MAEFPGFTIWTDAYLADTSHLTMAEHGGYLKLLIAMWRSGGYLPNDDKKLARFAAASEKEWFKVKPHLMEFFTEIDGQITQARLLDELEKARDRSRKASDNARSKYRKTKEVPHADAKRKRSETPATEHADLLQNASETPASISISISNNKSSLRSDSASAKPTPRQELLKVLDADRAEAVIEHRQRIRKPITAHAAKLLAGKLAKWHDANEAADAMVSNGWQGFEVEWMNRVRGSPAPQQKTAYRQYQDEMDQAFRDAINGPGNHENDGQPTFDLGSGDFVSDRTASAGKR